MTRRKTNPEEIRNPDHYFKKYISMEIHHDQSETAEYYKMFLSTDAILEGGEGGINREMMLSLSTNAKGELFEKAQAPATSREWIAQMQTRSLQHAMQELSPKQQDVLFYRYYWERSQTEVSEIMDISQQSISRLERRAKEKIEKILLGGCKKP